VRGNQYFCMVDEPVTILGSSAALFVAPRSCQGSAMAQPSVLPGSIETVVDTRMEVILEAVDNSMRVMAGELQDLQTAMKQADHRHDGLQRWIVHRIQTMEKCVGEDNFEERLRDQWLNQERLREGQAIFQERLKLFQNTLESHSHRVGQVFDFLASIKDQLTSIEDVLAEQRQENLRFTLAEQRQENRMEELEKSTKEQITVVVQAAHLLRNNNIENRLSYVVTELASTKDQLASMENRMEELEKSTKEQIAEELQALQTNREHEYLQTARELAATLFVLENDTGALRREVAGVLQALRTDREQAATHYARQANLENRVEEMEKVMRDQAEVIAEVQQTATEQATNYFVSADYWQASLKNRMESIEKLTKALIAEATSELENRLEKEQAAMEQAAWEQAAREIVWLTVCTDDRQTSLENRMKLTERQMSAVVQTTTEQTANRPASSSLENRVTSLENHTKTIEMGVQTKRSEQLQALQTDEGFTLVSDVFLVSDA